MRVLIMAHVHFMKKGSYYVAPTIEMQTFRYILALLGPSFHTF